MGLSDHLSLLLHSGYAPKIRSTGTTVRTVRIKPEYAISMLQDSLTSIPAKCLGRLVIKHIKAAILASHYPYQFDCRANQSTEDTIAIVLYTLLEYLETKIIFALVLFVDYSSAFNSIQPYRLCFKLHQLELNNTLQLHHGLSHKSHTVSE